MEGLPSGDIQAKYQKLAAEYSKLKVHVKVLKKGVLDEQAKSNELRELLKEKEKSQRKGELEIDSLTFRNQQLTRRVSVLQDEIEHAQSKATKKTKSKDDKPLPSSSNSATLDATLLQEELQKKIIENAQYASQLSDKVFEISQLKSSIEDCNSRMSECESKYKCEIAKLKNKSQELQFALEASQKDRLGGTPKVPAGSLASCNGDFLSEGGSLIGSEDALSSVDDLNVNEQLGTKLNNLELENQKIRMEFGLLEMENEALKLEVTKHIAAAQKRRADTHDSGDFNAFSETTVDDVGRIGGLLGSVQVPFLLSTEIQKREERLIAYFRNKITALNAERDELLANIEFHDKECEMLWLRFEEWQREKEADDNTIRDKHDTISRLEEELQSTSHNYEQHMSLLTEHVAALNDQLAAQHDSIQHLKHQLSTRKK